MQIFYPIKLNKKTMTTKHFFHYYKINLIILLTLFYINTINAQQKVKIYVMTATVSALYVNCGNELVVLVPELGKSYDPVFTSAGATVIAGKKKGQVTIVPNLNAEEVILKISNKGKFIGEQKFKVMSVPTPDEIVALADDKYYVNEKHGILAPGPDRLKIKLIPDKDFAEFMPKDARYRITKMDVFLVRGRKPVATISFRSGEANITDFVEKAIPGDRIVIEVLQVVRMNFKDEIEEVKLTKEIRF